MTNIFLIIIALIIGYLIGSISPAYILGRILKKIDIREHGDGNAGGTNTKNVLGWGPAVIVVIFDFTKGLLAMFIAWKLGLSVPFIYAAGFAAILGHIAPFYLGFRGGQGAATAVGMLFFSLGMLISKGYLPWDALTILAIAALSVFFITHSGTLTGIVVLPMTIYFVLNRFDINSYSIGTALIILFLFAVQVFQVHKKKLFALKPQTKQELIVWRLYMRPLALLLLVIYWYFGRVTGLWILGIITILASIPDIIRLLLPRVNKFFFVNWKHKVYKKKEKRSFSSITLFLFSFFMILLLFPWPIAVIALLFLVFGDMASKIFGIQFGHTHIFPKTHKDLEGALAYVSVCLAIGYIAHNYLPISMATVAIGAVVASIVETLPLGVDDNLTVALSSAASMFIAEKIF
ncbi:MAG: glycerol-3-phosphate acyltransferase [Candidatus Berkelbacteria bacterium]|nr:glycerol-3-phosphate acyltransferase [Candidatus Berkelbacteria bacterium]